MVVVKLKHVPLEKLEQLHVRKGEVREAKGERDIIDG